MPSWPPTLQDVADISSAYLRGEIDGNTEDSGAQRVTFDDTTDPTAVTVQGLIDIAVAEVRGRAGVPDALLAGSYAELAGTAAAWHAAAAIEAEKAPEGAQEAAGAYSWKQSTYVANLNELIAQVPRQNTRLA